MAWNLHAIEQMQLRGRRRVDGVGRPKFDFHTGSGWKPHGLKILRASLSLSNSRFAVQVSSKCSQTYVEIKFRAPHAIDAMLSP